MRKALTGAASALAIAAILLAGPAVAQKAQDRAASGAACTCPDGTAGWTAAATGGEKDPKPTGATPGEHAGAAAAQDENRSFRELADIIEPHDVSKGDGGRGSSGPERQSAGSADPASEGNSLVAEGEVVPDGIREVQDDEEWDGEFADDAQRRGALDGRELPDQAWSPGQGEPFHRGKLNPDPGNAQAQDKAEDAVPQARQRREAMDRDAAGPRRDRLARIALMSAKAAFPEAEFTHYRFGIDDGRRIVQIVGKQPDDNRRMQVDVRANGRVHAISERIPLERVPETVRSAVREEMGRFRVAHASRMIERDLDMKYQFAGFGESGRAATVEIGADGNGLTVTYADRASQ